MFPYASLPRIIGTLVPFEKKTLQHRCGANCKILILLI
jgi:hypothetical protein